MLAQRFAHCILVLLLCRSFVSAQAPPANANFTHGQVGEDIAEFVTAYAAEGFSGVVFAAKGGEVIAAVGVGYADLHRTTPITPDVLFEIASVTKSFTAAAVLELQQRSLLKISDSIAAHLPGIPDNCKAITIEHVLRHTSGIPGTNSAGAGDDIDAVLPLFLRGGPRHEPGTHWEYWNQGYSILSEIIARTVQRPYVDACRASLFEPAGMRMTCFTGDAAPLGAVVAIGRGPTGPPRSALDHPYGAYGFQYRGMGGMVTNAWDLWRWDRALAKDTVLTPASRDAMFTPGLNNYALGWFVTTTPTGRAVQHHGGGVRGFSCTVRRYPDDDAFMAVLSNRNDAPLHQVATGVEQMMFDEPVTIPPPLRSLDAATVEAIAGVYRDERGNTLIIELDGDVTRARVQWAAGGGRVTHGLIGLDADAKPTFTDRRDRLAFTIERDDAARSHAVSIGPQRYTREP